jgi:hypothetical protein
MAQKSPNVEISQWFALLSYLKVFGMGVFLPLKKIAGFFFDHFF